MGNTTPPTPPPGDQNPGTKRNLGGIIRPEPAPPAPITDQGNYPDVINTHGRATSEDHAGGGLTVVGEQEQPDPAPSGKKKRETPGKILSSSPHQEDYRRMMKAGWTSFALERFADYRYGEKIAASTFRNYKARMLARDPKWLDVTYLTDKQGNELIAHGVEVELDVMGVRQQLVHLQLQRIGVVVAEELTGGKLGADTWRELKLASDMLDKVREDQVAYGIMPATAAVTQFTLNDLPSDIPKQHSSLAGALGAPNISAPDLASVARTLGQLIPITKNQGRSAS